MKLSLGILLAWSLLGTESPHFLNLIDLKPITEILIYMYEYFNCGLLLVFNSPVIIYSWKVETQEIENFYIC